MKITPALKGMIFGAVLALLTAIIFEATEHVTDRPESINLLYACSALAVVVPAAIASLTNLRLFLAISTAYGAVAGFLFGRFSKQRRLLTILLLVVHLAGLVFVDFFLFKFVKLI